MLYTYNIYILRRIKGILRREIGVDVYMRIIYIDTWPCALQARLQPRTHLRLKRREDGVQARARPALHEPPLLRRAPGGQARLLRVPLAVGHPRAVVSAAAAAAAGEQEERKN